MNRRSDFIDSIRLLDPWCDPELLGHCIGIGVSGDEGKRGPEPEKLARDREALLAAEADVEQCQVEAAIAHELEPAREIHGGPDDCVPGFLEDLLQLDGD